MLRVSFTGDIDKSSLEKLVEDLSGDLEVELSDRVTVYKGYGGGPSWIQFAAEATWWQVFGAAAAAFAAGLLKEAGKGAWRNRAKVTKAASKAGAKVAKFALALVKLRGRSDSRTKLELALPVPDDHFGTRLELLGEDEDVVAAEIAIFAAFVPQIRELIDFEDVATRATAGVYVQIEDDGSVVVSWMDRKSHDIQQRHLKL